MKKALVALALIFCLFSSKVSFATGFFNSTSRNQTTNIYQYFFINSGYPYSAFPGPFASFPPYYDSIVVTPLSFPANTYISWSHPNSACSGVCGYLQVSYGNYTGGSANGVASKQLSAMTTLSSSLNFTDASTAPNGYDILYDIFLTASSGGTNPEAAEISVFMHTPSYACASGTGPVGGGSVTLSGIAWTVASGYTAGSQICFLPAGSGDLPNATIDLLGLMNWLVSVPIAQWPGGTNLMSSSYWFNGFAIGVEPRNNSGTVTINSWAVTYN